MAGVLIELKDTFGHIQHGATMPKIHPPLNECAAEAVLSLGPRLIEDAIGNRIVLLHRLCQRDLKRE